MAKEKNNISPYLLFGVASFLLTASWLMKSFPVLIFIGIAPLIAISDTTQKDKLWVNLELVLIALTVSLWANTLFSMDSLAVAMVEAIAITLLFLLFAYTKQSLGIKLGKLPLLLFWLGIEYLILKFNFTPDALFLADSLILKSDWTRWTCYTGYLGISLWILLTNLAFYYGALQNGIKPVALVLFLLLVAVPVVYSFSLHETPITRGIMESAYSPQSSVVLPKNYQDRAEWIPRTSAWISVLIVLFAIVKNNTRKK